MMKRRREKEREGLQEKGGEEERPRDEK